MGGVIGRVLSFLRAVRGSANVTDVKVELGGGPVRTGEHFAPPGDDSHPLPADYAYLGDTPQAGRVAALGYIDPANPPAAQPGEKRLYARNQDGDVQAVVWLKSTGEGELSNSNGGVTLEPDGSILGQNGSGSFSLQANGDFVVNGVTIRSDGSVDIPQSLTLDGREISNHSHAQGPDSAGNSEVPTGPNL